VTVRDYPSTNTRRLVAWGDYVHNDMKKPTPRIGTALPGIVVAVLGVLKFLGKL
jgi:hypothetical protein